MKHKRESFTYISFAYDKMSCIKYCLYNFFVNKKKEKKLLYVKEALKSIHPFYWFIFR